MTEIGMALTNPLEGERTPSRIIMIVGRQWYSSSFSLLFLHPKCIAANRDLSILGYLKIMRGKTPFADGKWEC